MKINQEKIDGVENILHNDIHMWKGNLIPLLKATIFELHRTYAPVGCKGAKVFLITQNFLDLWLHQHSLVPVFDNCAFFEITDPYPHGEIFILNKSIEFIEVEGKVKREFVEIEQLMNVIAAVKWTTSVYKYLGK